MPKDVHELAYRSDSWLEVKLLWESATNTVFIAMVEIGENRAYGFVIDNDEALDAFNHPFAYADREGVLNIGE